MPESNLLKLSAGLEIITAIALLAMPSELTRLLLGTPLETAAGTAASHVAGAALLALGIACWSGRRAGQTQTGQAVIAGMLVYNIAVVGVFLQARFSLGLSGIALWPAAAAHTFLAYWCFAELRRYQDAPDDSDS